MKKSNESIREVLWDVLQQAANEARLSKSSIRVRGKARILEYVEDFDDFYTTVDFDVQVTPDGVVHGPNIKEE